VGLEERIKKAEEELKPEEQGRDWLITCVTEQHVRVGDELVPVKREPIGYTEVKWGAPDRSGRRIGVRYALYDDDDKRGSNWTDEELNQPNGPKLVTED
jgi:hypothetical protein